MRQFSSILSICVLVATPVLSSIQSIASAACPAFGATPFATIPVPLGPGNDGTQWFGRAVSGFEVNGLVHVAVGDPPFGNKGRLSLYDISGGGNVLAPSTVIPYTLLPCAEAAANKKYFARNVFATADTIFSGAYGHGNSTGVAMLMSRNAAGTGWDAPQCVSIPNAAAGDKAAFTTIALGSNMLVGVAERNGHGAVYLLNTAGQQLGNAFELSPALQTPGEKFGRRFIDAGQDQILVGGPYKKVGGVDHIGAAYLFDLAGNRDVPKTNYVNPSNLQHSFFGEGLAVVGDYVIVSAPAIVGKHSATDTKGRVHVFNRLLGGPPVAELQHPGANFKAFGATLAVVGDCVVVGVAGNTNANSGAAVIYDLSGPVAGAVPPSQTITAPANSEASIDWFGTHVNTVTVSGTHYLVLGSPRVRAPLYAGQSGKVGAVFVYKSTTK